MMWQALLLLPLCWLGGCKNLPDIEPGTCGNKVIEKGEDCDVIGKGDLECRAPGTEAECHWDCRPNGDGTVPSCPSGWGCDGEGVCRKATGTYREDGPFDVGDVAWLTSADFDGDGQPDLVSTEGMNAYQQSRFRLHYLEEGELAETRVFPKQTTRPKIARLDDDASDDLLFSNLRIGVVPGRRDRAWVPRTFSTYRIQDGPIRMVGLLDNLVSKSTALAVLSTLKGVRGIFLPSIGDEDKLRLSVPVSEPLDDLMGELISADLLLDAQASPCREVLLAFRGESSVRFYDFCEANELEDQIEWRAKAIEHRIDLPEGALVDAPPLVADVNGDGLLDVVIGANGGTFVATGHGTHVDAVAAPRDFFEGLESKVAPPSSMPLAIGDVTGDGLADFVVPTAVVITRKGVVSGDPTLEVRETNTNRPWTVARIDDFNGDGNPDIVAASDHGPGMTFYAGTGTRFVIASPIEARSSVSLMTIDDFDGDQIRDIAFVEHNPARPEQDALRIAFGQRGATPQAPVQVAQLAQAEQLSAFHDGGIGNLMVASSEGTGAARRGLLTLLVGSPDRLPFAPFDLVSFVQDGDLTTNAAVELAHGAFTAPGADDVVAIATPTDDVPFTPRFWLVPGIDAGKDQSLRLEGELPKPLSAGRGIGPAVQAHVAASSADLDGDARDEALWLMPADEGAHCGLFTFGVEADPEHPRLTQPTTLLLERACATPTLSVRDLDGDKRPDVLVALGAQGEDGELRVLWNDGFGHFDASNASSIELEPGTGEVRAFASFAGKQPSLALMTDSGLWRVAPSAEGKRAFSQPAERIARLARGSAVTVLDLDGDGLEDIVGSDANGLWFWKARLE
jgi:hypothetical protein